MTLSEKQVNELYSKIELMRNKIIQFVRVKSELDRRRETYVANLRNQLSINKGRLFAVRDVQINQQTVEGLWQTYKRQLRVIEIVRKGVRSVKEYHELVEELVSDVKLSSYFRSRVKRLPVQYNLKSISLLKFTRRRVSKYVDHFRHEFNQLEHIYLAQFSVLEKIRQGDTSLVKYFLKLCDAEKKSIKKFYRKNPLDVLIKLIERLSSRDAAITLGIRFLVPTPPLSGPILFWMFGGYLAGILGGLLAIIKYAGPFVYAGYALRKR